MPIAIRDPKLWTHWAFGITLLPLQIYAPKTDLTIRGVGGKGGPLV